MTHKSVSEQDCPQKLKSSPMKTKTIRTIALGTVCTDIATQIEGTITHWLYNMSGEVTYVLQPRGSNLKTGLPVARIHLELARLKVSPEAFEEVEIPYEVLGSEVEDKATGFKGMAVAFVRYIDGCFHIVIQPEGLLGENNSLFPKAEFSFQGCKGAKIPVLSPEEKKKVDKETPSPIGDNSILAESFCIGGEPVLP